MVGAWGESMEALGRRCVGEILCLYFELTTPAGYRSVHINLYTYCPFQMKCE